MRVVVAEPLTPDAYAPYGDVIAAARRGEAGKPANQGTARRFDRTCALEDLRGGGRAPLNLAVFRCSPLARDAFPFEVAMLERHAKSTQVFVPMTARAYLAIVARGDDRPDLATLAAFLAGPAQGVSYRPGVWHHPMIALDVTTDFACLVHEDGSAADCDEVSFPPGERARVVLAV